MNKLIKPYLTALISICVALTFIITATLITAPAQISFEQQSTYSRSLAQSDLSERAPLASMDHVVPVLRNGFRSTIAILRPSGRVMCAGTLIKNEEGKSIEVLTAWHCVRGAFPNVIPVGLLYNGVVMPMIVSKHEEKWDLAVLSSVFVAPENGPVAKFASGPPQLGETVWMIGHPRGIIGNVTRGVLSNVLHVDDDLRYYRIDAHIFYGNSGGGMYNHLGELVGVADAVEYDRNPGGSTQLVPGGGLCVSLYNVNILVGR